MTDNTAVFNYIADLLEKLFEVERDEITLESHIYQDFDIDSIDAVDMIVELKKYTGKKIKPEDFKTVRTVGDMVNAVSNLLDND